MECKEKVRNLFDYMLSIKKMDEGIITNINQYEKVYWQKNMDCNWPMCIKNDSNKEEWFEVDKNNKELYDEFFKLYFKLQKNSENLEIVWGNYILAWKAESENIINPIFTTKMELDFDAEKGKFSLKPYDGKTKVETNIFAKINIPDIDKILKIKDDLEGKTFDPRNIEETAGSLYKMAHYMSSEVSPSGEIERKLCGITDIITTKYPVFYNAPVIIVRKLDNRLWNSELKSIIKLIEAGYPIPPTIEAMVEEKDVHEKIEEKESFININKEILFPLPSNEEQKEVVDRLSKNYGVVVQGPPGTGKSHTIVNLICHLLAHGKRVLVTSQTGRALRVLSERIPEEIRPLCVSILGDDTKSLKELDESVRIITEKLSVNPEVLKSEITYLKKDLENCREKQNNLYKSLKEVDVIEYKKLNIDGKNRGLIDIAKWTREHEKAYSYIDDCVKLNDESPVTDEEMHTLIEALNGIDIQLLKRTNRLMAILEELPEVEEIYSKISIINAFNETKETYIENIKNIFVPKEMKLENYKELIRLIELAQKSMKKIEGSWLKNICTSYYNSEILRPNIKYVYMKLKYYIGEIAELERKVSAHKIKVPEGTDLYKFKKEFNIVYERFIKKGKWGYFYKFINKKYSYIFYNCFVNENIIESKEQLEIIKYWINESIMKSELLSLWDGTMKAYGAEELKNFNAESMLKLEQLVKELDSIINWNINIKNKIKDKLGNIDYIENIDWYKSETYAKLEVAVKSLNIINQYKAAKAFIINCSNICLSSKELASIGKDIKEMNLEGIKQKYKEVTLLKESINKVKEIMFYINKLSEIVPIFTLKLLNSENREGYSEFNTAFHWKKLSYFFNKAHELKPEVLDMLLHNEKAKEATLIKEIVSREAWYRQIKYASDIQKRSLFAWMQAVKRIGKGTGKYADKYRNMAQKEMEICKDTIPVWIMPLNKVIENIKADSSPFDVVIFDESSQSDIFALCALFRGKRAIIVGDDKQISPQTVGVDQDIVNDLIRRHLKGIPHAEWFDLETSLYNTALRVFPDRLLLKEHFRCVPEIIGFNNDLCYSNQIIPLRNANKDEIFENPIVAIKIQNGEKDRFKNINMEEAKALVEKVVNCCQDKKYKNMTMGVISLLGDQQAEVIENMLRHKIGEEEMVRRKLICGDAYTFQGDERDIIFLSMVVAENTKFTPLTREVDIRRFNVAVSRARNQFWLFYSFNEDNLNPECVRSKLIRYCNENSLANLSSKDIDIQDEFNKDIYTMLREKGYKVRPFVKLGNHQVDFIIEDDNNRLALECSGNKTFMIDRWEINYDRHRVLERAGWKFYTIKGSEFYRNPEETMGRLWKRLDSLGIKHEIV